VSNQIVEVNTRRLESALLAKNVTYTKIDGAAPDAKELRSAMWEASGVRGYPQLFIDGKVIGGGTFDQLQELSACFPLPCAIHTRAHPCAIPPLIGVQPFHEKLTCVPCSQLTRGSSTNSSRRT
jgi:glutaredoxin